jgi:DNA-binding GntR family transcriptional regulator
MPSKYEKIISTIEKKIKSGIWPTGMLMPTESELCTLFEVSRITVRRALAELEKLGLVERIQGKGSFVGKMHFHSTDCQGFRDSMALQGITVRSTIITQELITPTIDIVQKLQLGAGPSSFFEGQDAPGSVPFPQEVWHFCRLRYVDNTPVAIMHSYIPKVIGDQFVNYELNDASFYRLIAEITGKEVIDTKGAVTATVPTPAECELLKVAPGTAHIWYRSVGYLEDGQPVEVSSSIFNAELYEFSVRYEHLQSCQRV